jgi:drug/metabolite transporter (DMT)-like permease
VTNAGMVGIVVPVIAVFLGAIVLGETRSLEGHAGARIVIGAVVFALLGGGSGH